MIWISNVTVHHLVGIFLSQLPFAEWENLQNFLPVYRSVQMVYLQQFFPGTFGLIKFLIQGCGFCCLCWCELSCTWWNFVPFTSCKISLTKFIDVEGFFDCHLFPWLLLICVDLDSMLFVSDIICFLILVSLRAWISSSALDLRICKKLNVTYFNNGQDLAFITFLISSF